MVNNFKEVSEETGKKLQLALINALYKQIKSNPNDVSASVLAVAERMLARWNMGLIELPEDKEMTKEEIELVKEFEKLNMNMSSDIFKTEH